LCRCARTAPPRATFRCTTRVSPAPCPSAAEDLAMAWNPGSCVPCSLGMAPGRRLIPFVHNPPSNLVAESLNYLFRAVEPNTQPSVSSP
jgi:hypothetical protein